MKLGILAGITILSEILPFTPLKSNGVVQFAMHALQDAGLLKDRQVARIENAGSEDREIEIYVNRKRGVVRLKI
jgi:hypothetical protein